MRYSSRFFLYAPFSLFVILAIAVGVQWWREASAWSQKIDALNGHEIAPGITLHFASRQLTGFPFRVDTVFKDLRLSFAGPRAFKWKAEDFALHRLSYGSGKTVFEAGGIGASRSRRHATPATPDSRSGAAQTAWSTAAIHPLPRP